MKLQTTIKPRREGAVRVKGLDGADYVFAADADGDLVCDVTDEATVKHLLATNNFGPVDVQDMDAALRLTGKSSSVDPDDDGNGGGDDELPPDALPIEAATPPKAKTAAARAKAAARKRANA